MNCPYCDAVFVRAANQPADARLTAYVCPVCSWRLTTLAAPPTPPPAPQSQTAGADNVRWFLERLPSDPAVCRVAETAVLLYVVDALEIMCAARDRHDMRRQMDFARETLVATLRPLIDLVPGKDGAK